MTLLHSLSFPCLTRESIVEAGVCMDAGSNPASMHVVFSFFTGFQEGIRVHDRLNIYFYNSEFRTLMNYSG